MEFSPNLTSGQKVVPPDLAEQFQHVWKIIGIDHDTVCAGVVGTAIRNSTSCAGRRAAVNHDSADRISGQFLFYHDHNLQKK